jgi:hypothetical protein
MAETPRPSDPDTKAAPGGAEGGARPSDDSPGAPASPLERARARGRRIAFALFYAVAAAISLAGAVQIFSQAFRRHEAPEAQIRSCSEGLSRLSSAVARARRAASVTDGEDAALDDFRKALLPDWDSRDQIEDLCRPSAASMADLDAIEQLRYAEEHAVRREAAELAPLRRRVQKAVPLEAEPAQNPSDSAPSSTASGTHLQRP